MWARRSAVAALFCALAASTASAYAREDPQSGGEALPPQIAPLCSLPVTRAEAQSFLRLAEAVEECERRPFRPENRFPLAELDACYSGAREKSTDLLKQILVRQLGPAGEDRAANWTGARERTCRRAAEPASNGPQETALRAAFCEAQWDISLLSVIVGRLADERYVGSEVPSQLSTVKVRVSLLPDLERAQSEVVAALSPVICGAERRPPQILISN